VIPLRGLFETHLNVRSLDVSVAFYRDTLELPLAAIFDERRVAFFWIGAPGRAMLGLWETGPSPLTTHGHFAFDSTVEAVLEAPGVLGGKGVALLDFDGRPAREPVVLGWMPAVSVYFRDPDGHLLECLAMLPEPPAPEAGILPWSRWRNR
jgi:lactoylglutathione lyase